MEKQYFPCYEKAAFLALKLFYDDTFLTENGGINIILLFWSRGSSRNTIFEN
jgi:hypothetical protein